jgi:glycosyltransferase involved in cell wall biosynthesis
MLPPVTRRDPAVSVIVAAYDEAAHIGGLLESLDEQTAKPLEVIVADDGSRDDTAAIAERAGATVLRREHRGPAAARNAGAAAASGEILVFLDGDMECSPQFLERLVAPIAAGEAPGTFTREIFLANRQRRWARAYAALRWSPPDRLLPADGPDRFGAYRAIRADAFHSVGGFDDVGYGEDMTIAAKLGEEALVAPGAVLLHHHPDSLAEIFGNGRWVGRGEAIRELPHPFWTHSLPRTAVLGLRQVAAGRTPWVVPARAVYHSGVLLGLCEATVAPGRHWK